MENILQSFIKSAEIDLASAKILYKKGNFTNSIFLFQQAVEKANKVSALMTRQVDPSIIKSVRHDYLRLARKGLNSYPQEHTEHLFKLVSDNGLTDYIESDELYKTINSASIKEFFYLNEEDLKYYLKLIRKYKAMNKKLFSTDLGYNTLIELALSSGKLTPQEHQNLILEKDSGSLNVSNSENMLNHVFTINILGLITSPHSEMARYPTFSDSNELITCPVKIYTLDMPIIKHQKKFMKMAETSINFIKTELKM